MKTIWLGDNAHVSAYSAAVKGTDAVVTVKIKVTDSYGLGHLLSDLEGLRQAAVEERREAAAAKAAARKPAAATRPAIEHQQTKLLPYFGGDKR